MIFYPSFLQRFQAGETEPLTSLAYSPDGKRLAAGGVEGLVYIWELASGRMLMKVQGHQDRVTGVAFSSEGAQLATVGGDGTLRLFTLDLEKLIELARLRLTRSLSEAECRQYLHLAQCPAQLYP